MSPKSFRSVVLAFAVFLFAAAAFASVRPPLTIEAALVKGRRGPALVVALTPHLETIHEVTVRIESSGSLLAEDGDTVALTLANGVTSRIRMPLGELPDGDLGTVLVRVVPKDSTEAAAYQRFYFMRDDRGGVRKAALDEYAAALQSRMEAAATDLAAKNAAAHVVEMVRRGLTPAPYAAGTDSIDQRAWNHAVAGEDRKGEVRALCGDFTIANWNNTFNASGSLRYEDMNSPTTQSDGTGHLMYFYTSVDYVDSCANVQQRTSVWTASTNAGRFNLYNVVANNVFTPFSEINTTPPDTGLRTSGASMTPQIERIVNQADMYYYWNGYTASVQPTYNHTNNPYYFLLRWQDEIFRLRGRWVSRGMGSWADFKAAFDGSTSGYPQAYFFQLDPSAWPNALVVFNGDGAVSYKWVMAHEFGHFFQYRMQHAPLCCGGVHYISQQSDPATALSEGFADWHGNANETEGRSSYYYWCTSSECGPNPGLYGYTVEANVAGYFWDIFDNYNDPNVDGGIDNVLYAYSTIFNAWQKNSNYGSFHTFWDDLWNKGIWAQQPNSDPLTTWNKVSMP